MNRVILFVLCTAMLFACKENNTPKEEGKKNKNNHHLNIPSEGIHTIIESNTSKILEGTHGAVILMVGDVSRKKADISLKRNDKIVFEKLMKEDEDFTIDYDENMYDVKIKNIKKPLLGAGKVELIITEK